MPRPFWFLRRQDMLARTPLVLHSRRHPQDQIWQRPKRHRQPKPLGQIPLLLRPTDSKLRGPFRQQPCVSREAVKLLLGAAKLHSESGVLAAGLARRAEARGSEGVDVQGVLPAVRGVLLQRGVCGGDHGRHQEMQLSLCMVLQRRVPNLQHGSHKVSLHGITTRKGAWQKWAWSKEGVAPYTNLKTQYAVL